VEKADSIRAEFGRLSYILPNKFMKTDYGEALRSILKDRISEIIDFRSNQVFESATTYTCVITVTDTDKAEYISIGSPKGLEAFSKGEDYLIGLKDYELEKSLSNLQDSSWSFKQPKVQDALDKIDEKKSIGEREGIQGYDGLRTNADTAILFEFEREKKETYVVTTSMSDSKFEIEKGLVKKCLKGTEISKYHVGTAENVVLYPYENGEVISEAEVEEKYPKIWSYLNRDEIKDKLQNRKGSFDKFYELTDPRTRQKFEGSKIVAQTLSKRTTACLDEDKYYFVGGGTAGAKGIRTEDREKLGGLEAIINSSLSSFYLKNRGSEFNNNYYAFSTSLIKSFGLPEDIEEKLPDLSDKRRNLSSDYESINLNIQDYLGNYSDGKTLGDLYTPAEGLSDQVLSDTSADRDSLRIGGVEFEERNNQLILKASARYKPDDSENIDEDELDRWGYFETESVPVMKFDVDDKLKPLIEEFVSLAVDEAGGFANFRESATKTNSVVDRLEKLTLPKLSDVESGLEKFIENREDAEELENEIQETDELIDAIVFNLYDLNKEEVETVLDSLDTEQGEKERILERFRSI